MKKFLITIFVILMLPLVAFAKPKTTVNVAFTIDNNYPIFTLLAINSILYNNYSNSNYHFYIVENNLSELNKSKMRNYIEKANNTHVFKSEIEFIDVNTDKIDGGNYLFAFSNRITPIAIARIMLPELLPDLDKVLYLDGDILVTTDLYNLYRVDLGNYVAGMAPNITQGKDILKKGDYKDIYYNSGVILMNLKKCREIKSTEKMTKYLKENMDKFIYDRTNMANNKDKFLYPDQDLINVVWHGQIMRIPQSWNNQTIDGVVMVDTELGSRSIMHYLGPTKPWHFRIPRNRFENMYMVYWNNCLELKHYKYYYAFKKVYKNTLNLAKSKIERNITFIKNILARKEVHTVFELFYTEPEILN